MPRFDLTEAERLALALFVTNERELQGVDDAFRSAQARHPGVTRETGRDVYLNLGCGACHTHPEGDGAVAAAPDLSGEGGRVREDWLESYLSDPVTIRPAGAVPGRGSRMPDFRLTADEASALSSYLAAQRGTPLPAWQADRLSPFSMQKAETLLRDRWSCLGCHQLGPDGGGIGPRLDGVSERLRPEFLRAFIEDPGHLAPGTVMPASLEQPDRLDLMASFLLQHPGTWAAGERHERLALSPALDPATETEDAEAPSLEVGEALYQRRCATCHGVTGAGDGFNAPYLPVVPTVHADGEAMSLRPDDTLYDGIHAGGWILGKSHRMPAFGGSLSPTQIRSLVLYIRQLCSCEGPAWSRDGRRGS
ncbi:MAG: c-type cytochrome [Gemmatimonadetes bacterium]|nr:c-type cytochrome [Gemmatimonadota bacterium]